jgi:hypothetical protein
MSPFKVLRLQSHKVVRYRHIAETDFAFETGMLKASSLLKLQWIHCAGPKSSLHPIHGDVATRTLHLQHSRYRRRFYPLDEILVQTIHILLRFNAANRQRYTSHLTTTSMSSIHLSLYNVSRIMGTRYA